MSEIQPPKGINYYNEKNLYKELNLFLEWNLKINFSKNKKKVIEWNNLWKNLFKGIKYNKNCLVLRDFHIDNIFYLEKRYKLEKIGLIDYQDALIGHASYDLVSLLQDVRVNISVKDQKILFDYYIKSKKINKKDFEIAYLVLGTQRLLKIVGVFNRLHIKYNNPSYLRYLPRTWKILNRNLKNPIFVELVMWLKQNNFLQND